MKQVLYSRTSFSLKSKEMSPDLRHIQKKKQTLVRAFYKLFNYKLITKNSIRTKKTFKNQTKTTF